MSHKCAYCGEITMTPNHVCEQATQKMIDQMDKATETVQSWSKEKRETMNLSKEQEPAYDRLHNICRNVGMGFKEATELLNQLVLGTYNENNKLRAELSAERDKWDYYQNFVKGHGADSITDLVVQRDKERKKREEAEADVYKLGQENIELEADLSATKKKCDEYREMANKVQIGGESFQLQFLAEEEDKCRGLEIQVEVLREALEEEEHF